MGFSRQDYWGGLSFPFLGDPPDARIKPESLAAPALAGTFFTTEPPCNYKLYHMFNLKLYIKNICNNRQRGERFNPNWSLGFLNKLVAPKNYAFDIDSSSQKIIFLTFQGQAADLPRSRCWPSKVRKHLFKGLSVQTESIVYLDVNQKNILGKWFDYFPMIFPMTDLG